MAAAPDIDEWQPATLSHLLEKEAVPFEHIRQDRFAAHFMVSRQYMEINPSCLTTRDIIMPALLNIPFTDFGVGPDPAMRSMVMHVTSESYGCNYCREPLSLGSTELKQLKKYHLFFSGSSHGLTFGNVLQGGALYMEKTAKAYNPQCSSGELTDKERVVVESVKALAQVPSKFDSQNMNRMLSSYSEGDTETILMMSFGMGYLNRFMDIFGVPVEQEASQNAERVLGPTIQWTAGKHVASPSMQHDSALAQQDPPYPTPANENLGDKLRLARAMLESGVKGEVAKMDIPFRRDKIQAFFQRYIGFMPGYLNDIKSSTAQRAICASFRIALTMENAIAVPTSLKYAVCFFMATKLDRRILASQFSFLASRSGMSMDTLASVLQFPGANSQRGERLSVALNLAQACLTSPVELDIELAKKCVEVFGSRGIVDLVSAISLFNLVYWLTTAYPQTEMEEPVERFVNSPPAAVLFLSTQSI